MSRANFAWAVLKLCVFGVSLIPFSLIVLDTLNDNLGANPIQTLHFKTGDWAIRFLLLTLSLTPIRLLFHLNFQQRFRRMFGLFAFFYASLHATVYFVLDLSFSWAQMVEDVPKKPYVLVGLTAYVFLIPLALTSTRAMMRRLGPYWKKLHRSVYLIALLAVVHYFWLVKADYREPIIYALILLGLLGVRKIHHSKRRRQDNRLSVNARKRVVG